MFGVVCGLVPDYWSFVSMRLIIGITTSGVFLVSYVLAMEMVGPQYRVIAGTLCMFYYTFGYFLMAGVSYLLNDNWRILQIILSAPAIIFIPYWWFTPESVRWLVQKGRHDEARLQIKKVAKANGKDPTSPIINEVLRIVEKEHQEAEMKKNSRDKMHKWKIFII